MKLLGLLPSVSPYALIGMCTARLRELICAKSLAARGEASRVPDALKVPAWRVKNHVAWAARFTDDELRHALSSARDCERAMKSGSEPNAAFRDWLISVVAESR